MRISVDTPLDKLLLKHGINRSILARKIAERELKKIGVRADDVNHLNTRFKTYIGELSRYARHEREPKVSMFYSLARTIGCNPEQLFSTLKQDKLITEENEIDEDFLIAQGYKFRCLELRLRVYYNGNFVYWSKTFKIKSLVNNLEQIEKLDHYNCVRQKNVENKEIKVTSSDLFPAEKVYDKDPNENYVNLTFKKPLKKGEEVDFMLCYSAEKVLPEDTTCHYTWVRFPIQSLIMTVTPPNAIEGQKARMLEYKSLHESKIWDAGTLLLDESLNFEWSITNPSLYHFYKISWE